MYLCHMLPTSRKELDRLGIDTVDIILFTGDAYIDHPSFGAAVIGRDWCRDLATPTPISLSLLITPSINYISSF